MTTRNEKYLQRSLWQELVRKGEQLFGGDQNIFIRHPNTAAISNFQVGLLNLGYKWYDGRDEGVRMHTHRLAIDPINRTMCQVPAHVEANWRLPEDVAITEIMNLLPFREPKVEKKPDTKELDQYIEQAINDRRIWIGRRQDQIEELTVVRRQMKNCKSKADVTRLMREAQRIRGTYGASQTN